jgi:hypothetical protein
MMNVRWADEGNASDFRGVWTDDESVVHARRVSSRYTVCFARWTQDGLVTFAGHLAYSNLCPDCVRNLREQEVLT